MSAPQYPGQYPYPQQPFQQPPKKKGMSTGCIIAIVVVLVFAVPLIGTFAALGIYGVRKYIATAKTAEAKNTVGAIARAGVASYERDQKLCASARPVPAVVQKATKYAPSAAEGSDFNSGDDHTGWKCLRFSMTQPIYYQYQYHAGSGYLTPAAASIGPKGFEAAAVGDLNGDGVDSHFARTARVDASGQIVLSTEIYIDNEFE
jgi:type IV pilus assembly protein PilA